MATTRTSSAPEFQVVSKERLWGTPARWQRFGAPVAAGDSTGEDGSVDLGLFGPDSVVWQVLLHPATVVFQFAAQQTVQVAYKPIMAGVRDHDPISRLSRKGRLTFFEVFERGQRNSGMHAPMWLGDSATATLMRKHLGAIHQKVRGDVIDVGTPELGGYAASEPRDAMWAVLTEMHSMLLLYEAFAFRDGRLPHRLSDAERDQFVREVGAYCRLVGSPEAEIPESMADLEALYVRYADLFGHTDTMNVHPASGADYQEVIGESLRANFHRSQVPSILYALALDHGLFRQLYLGALPTELQRAAGLGPVRGRVARVLTRLGLPLVWVLQQAPFERHYGRLMWGPDGVRLIASARRLVRQRAA
ncbi:MAG: oxygenase MpaB family protein [Nocardioides sp.]|uniref:oxygenase MpaB family protein n=1 Tax=Nocardioides sp. TaxID=35761 RepID=UPI003F0B768D